MTLFTSRKAGNACPKRPPDLAPSAPHQPHRPGAPGLPVRDRRIHPGSPVAGCGWRLQRLSLRLTRCASGWIGGRRMWREKVAPRARPARARPRLRIRARPGAMVISACGLHGAPRRCDPCTAGVSEEVEVRHQHAAAGSAIDREAAEVCACPSWVEREVMMRRKDTHKGTDNVLVDLGFDDF